ncbi:hypothetical protein ACFFU9_06090 [Mariniflexile ostreae]|uniref:Uncharacterized protein n=1 Tax=Mariniflexile ostreae TaxID=1520892 RepID=A0ABV5FA67_9FLAO
MIKEGLHKVFSMALALLVLISTVSFTIEKHFCGDVLIDASVFAEVERCGMESAEIQYKKSCCKDEVDVIQGQDKLKSSSFEDLDFKQQQFITVFAFVFKNTFKSLSQQVVPHKNYSPPILISDIQVLDQVFII